MQLRRVRVQNIRSYGTADVQFPPGTTLISGDVGAGKTSLLYAIEMALFGVAEVDASYLVRHGTPHAEVEVEFEDTEHRYGIRRRFRRVLRRGRPTFEPERISFTIDGSETAYSATELRQRVIDLLGFADNPSPQAHSDLWRWAVYVPQERMRDILSARPQDRLETVRKALGVERYRIAADNAQELAADLRRSAVARRAEADRLQHFDREHAEWSLESDRLHGERVRLQEAVARSEETAEARRAERAQAEARVRETETVRTVLESLEREDAADRRTLDEGARERSRRLEEMDRRQQEVDSARREADLLGPRKEARASTESAREVARGRLDSLGARLRELAEARAAAASAARQVSEARDRSVRSARDLSDARERRNAVRSEGPTKAPLAPTEVPVATLDERLVRAREAERFAAQELAIAERSRSELAELLTAGVCPRCGQTVRPAEFSPHQAEADASVARAEAGLREAVNARTRLEEERKARERYERAYVRWTEIEKRRVMADEALAASESADASAADARRAAEDASRLGEERVRVLKPAEEEERNARGALEEEERRLRNAMDLVDRSLSAAETVRASEAAHDAIASELGRRDRELANVQGRWEERRRRMEQLADTLSGSAERQDALADAERRLDSAEGSLAEEKSVLVRIETRLDEAVRRIAEAERGRTERSKFLQEAEELTAKASWISGPFRTAVLSMEQQLLAHAQDAFERNFARYFASLVDDPALVARTDVAFTPAVTIDDEWTPAEALSGGERTSLALAFRLALARVVRAMGDLKLETILLDEPTDGFSPEQVVRMGELLDELALPQVVLVSHESELAAIADRVVRVEKRDGRSMILPDGGKVPTTSEEAPSPTAPPAPSRRTAVRPKRRRAGA